MDVDGGERKGAYNTDDNNAVIPIPTRCSRSDLSIWCRISSITSSCSRAPELKINWGFRGMLRVDCTLLVKDCVPVIRKLVGVCLEAGPFPSLVVHPGGGAFVAVG